MDPKLIIPTNQYVILLNCSKNDLTSILAGLQHIPFDDMADTLKKDDLFATSNYSVIKIRPGIYTMNIDKGGVGDKIAKRMAEEYREYLIYPLQFNAFFCHSMTIESKENFSFTDLMEWCKTHLEQTEGDYHDMAWLPSIMFAKTIAEEAKLVKKVGPLGPLDRDGKMPISFYFSDSKKALEFKLRFG